MKKRILIVAALIASMGSMMQAQTIVDAHKYSQTDLMGTARSMGMGGAMGAVGNDITAVSINPGGIGQYRRANEIVTTMDFRNVKTETNMGTNIEESKFKFKFDNLAFVGSFDLGNDVAPYLNVGFSYNKIKNFDVKYGMLGSGYGASLNAVMADKANRTHEGGKPYNPNDLTLTNNSQNNIDKWLGADWLPIMGYSSGLIGYGDQGYSPIYSNPTLKAMMVREKGSINSYDFNIGTEFEKIFSAGLSVSITDINYSLFSSYEEEFFGGTNKEGHFVMDNFLKSEGTGYQFSLGFILKPIDEFSFGVAYHSPTWYSMKDYAVSHFNFDFADPLIDKAGSFHSLEGADLITEYRLRTPDRWVFSLATAIKANGRKFITLSGDYELTNYKNMKLDNRGGSYLNYYADNQAIKDYYRMSSTVRVGAEIAFTPQFFGRIGYSWQQAAANKTLQNQEQNGSYVHTQDSRSQYVVNGDANYFTWGLGYRFTSNVFTDIAFIYRNQKDDLYHHAGASKLELTNNSYQGVWSIGVRF